MKVWFDTEFIEDGRTIDLLSIGFVREDGEQLYREAAWTDRSRATQWVKENVIPHLGSQEDGWMVSRENMRRTVVEFCGEKPEFWAYYCSYDWVVLCQLFGTMLDLPKGWPMFCNDVKQFCNSLGNPQLPKQEGVVHSAMADAVWTKQAWQFLIDRKD